MYVRFFATNRYSNPKSLGNTGFLPVAKPRAHNNKGSLPATTDLCVVDTAVKSARQLPAKGGARKGYAMLLINYLR